MPAEPPPLLRSFVVGAPRVSARLDEAGWVRTSSWDFDLYWRPQVPSRAAFASLRPGMRVNHIPGIGAITSPRITGRTSKREPDLSRFVLVAGVDPLRVYVHGGDGGEEETDRIIAQTILEGRDAMTRAVRDLVADRDACFEVLRFDFARREDGRVHLLRCMLSPGLGDHADVDHADVVDDTLRLLGIVPFVPREHPPVDLQSHWRTIAEGEVARRGGFRRIVPSEATNGLFADASLPRWSDVALTPALAREERLELRAARGFAGKRLVLFAVATQRFYVTNQVGGYVWLRLEDGESVDAIAEELHGRFSIGVDVSRSDVWDLAARWAHDGLLARAGAPAAPPKDVDDAIAAPIELVALDDGGLRLRSGSYASSVFHRENELVPLLRRCLAARSHPRDRAVIGLPGVAVARGRACVVLAGPEPLGGAAVAAVLSSRSVDGARPGATPFASGTVFVDYETGTAFPSAFGLEISEVDERDVVAAIPDLAALPSYTLPSELLARYLPFEPRSPSAPAMEGVTALVFVRRTATDAAATLTPIESLTALEELVHHGIDFHPPLTVAAAESFFAWLNDLSIFVLDMGGDLASAADHVDALLRRGDHS